MAYNMQMKTARVKDDGNGMAVVSGGWRLKKVARKLRANCCSSGASLRLARHWVRPHWGDATGKPWPRMFIGMKVVRSSSYIKVVTWANKLEISSWSAPCICETRRSVTATCSDGKSISVVQGRRAAGDVSNVLWWRTMADLGWRT